MRLESNTVNILRNADIRNCVSCVHDNLSGYSVSWDVNNNLGNYSVVGGVVSHTTWDGIYFGVSVSGSCYIQNLDQISIDGSAYTQVRLYYRVDCGNKAISSLTGKVQFKTSGEVDWSEDKAASFTVYPDNAYHEYVIDMSYAQYWQGVITDLRVYPFVDGLEGVKFYLKNIKVESKTRYWCDTINSANVCDKYYDYSHPCPWVGSPGFALSATVTGVVTIVPGVNDSLLVNIDDYGYHTVKLRSVVGAILSSIAFDIQEKLNLVGVGGYSFARCYVDESRIKIESDWHNVQSTVSVLEPYEASACRVLGFFGTTGQAIYTTDQGVTHASMYETPSVMLSSSALSFIRGSDRSSDESSFYISATDYSVYGGNNNYKDISRDTKLEFRDKTIIDYCNPITQTGKLVLFCYSGDRYTNTCFRVYREKIDGSLSLVSSVDISSEEDIEDEVFEIDISVDVKKGDLLGMYSGALHTGSEKERGNYSYYLYDDDQGGPISSIEPLSGTGEAGLPLYSRGSRKASEAVLDIVFDEVLPLETIKVRAEVETSSEDINLCTVRAGGSGGGPYVTGYTGLDSGGAQAPSLVNVEAVIDGDKQDINGTSVYCYPGWLDLSLLVQEDYYYTPFSIGLDFLRGVNTTFDIYKVKLYFVDNKNIKSFRLEVPLSYDANDENKIWGIGFQNYNEVYTELGLMDSDNIYLYNNPAILTAGDYQVGYAHLDYKYLELVFDPYKAKAIRYNATLDGYLITDESQLDYSYFPIAPSPKIQEIEVFATSTPIGGVSSYFSLRSSKDGTLYHLHNDIDIISSTEAGYTVGRPTRFMRMGIKVDNPIRVFDIYGTLSEGLVGVDSNSNTCLGLNSPINSPELGVEKITITNDSTEESTFYVDILEDRFPSEKCLLWNKLDTDDSLEYGEIGPGAIVHRREPFYLRAHNYAYKCPGYFLDSSFLKEQIAYISLDGGVSWSSIGTTVTDGQYVTYITNEYELYHEFNTMYVAIPLGNLYAIEGVTLEAPSGSPVFDGPVLYSDYNTTNPADIPFDTGFLHAWSVSYKPSARWLLIQVVGTYVGNVLAKYLANVQVTLDFSSFVNRGKFPWVSASGKLTNGVSGYSGRGEAYEEGWIKDGRSQYFCVDLKWFHNVSNVIAGPFSILADSIEDIDVLVAGEWPSLVDSIGVGSNVAYSVSPVDDPADVSWGSFGSAPTSDTRWVLVKTTTRVEEIIVHVDSNVQENKKSFISDSWCSCTTLTPYMDVVNVQSGSAAVGVTYPASYGLAETFSISQSFGIDHDLSPRDSLTFWLYISDVSELDLSSGYFRLGRSISQDNTPININLGHDTTSYYQWPLSLLGDYLEDGWNVINLPFSDNFKVGELYFTRDDSARIGSSSKRDRITYIEFNFIGVNSNSEFNILFDDFRIARRYYSMCKFGYGTYLPYREHVKFQLNDFDPIKGTIEFFLKPDWNRTVLCNSCGDPRDHTLVRVFSTEDSSLFLLYMSGDGLSFYITDGSNDFAVVDNSLNGFLADEPTHIALVWDFDNRYGQMAASIYINNIFSVGLSYSYLNSINKLPVFYKKLIYIIMLGGQGWEGLVSSLGSSADAVFENIKVYNYPIYDFSYSISTQGIYLPKRSHELIEVSLDNTNFVSYSDTGGGLPLVKPNVASDSCFDVFVRAKDISLTKPKEFNRRGVLTVYRV